MLIEKSNLVASFTNRNQRTVDKSSINDSLAADSYILWACHVSLVADDSCVLEEFWIEMGFMRCVVSWNVVGICLVVRVEIFGPGASFDTDPDSQAKQQHQTEFTNFL